jgi:hypothetical protein
MSACRRGRWAVVPQRLSLNRAGHTTYTGGFQGGAAGGKGRVDPQGDIALYLRPERVPFLPIQLITLRGHSGIRVSTALQGSRWDACSSFGREGLLRVVGAFDHSIAPRGVWVAGAVKLEVAPGLWGRDRGARRDKPRPHPLPSDYRSLTSSRLRIFPLGPRGSAARNSMRRGICGHPSAPGTRRSASRRPGPRPRLRAPRPRRSPRLVPRRRTRSPPPRTDGRVHTAWRAVRPLSPGPAH